ncbi:hypothetical protein Tco_1038557 [Tanacetum coccineum]
MTLNDWASVPPEMWVNPCSWLSTWKETYSHKIQPICGTKYWEKSTCPTTLLPPKHHVQVGRPRKKRKRSKHEDEPFVKDGKLSRKGRTITCQSCGNTGHNKATCKGQGRKATTGGNNAEASGSASRQAQQTEPAVGQDGSGGSGAGAVIGLSAAAGEGGVGGPGVASQGSSHSRWTKRRVQTERISPQKRTPTQPASQPSTSSQVPVSETRNADGREMGDGVPTQSSAAGGASGSGAGAVIGLSAAASEGGAGVASQGSSRSRWTKRRVQIDRELSKRSHNQPVSSPSTSSQSASE